MDNSKRIAGLVGPSLIAMTLSEAWNVHIWATSIAPVIYLNGSLLFIAGLAIVRTHNLWLRSWPVVVTLVGWFIMLLGLTRMFAPEFYLRGVQHTSAAMLIASIMFVSAIGIYLTFKAYGKEKS